MRRFLALAVLVCLSIPAGVSFTGCVRNPAGNYCNGEGFGTKIGQVYSIDLEPRTTGISLAFGQTRQITPPTAKDCKGTTASVGTYTYGTTNNQLVDLTPAGEICAGTWNRNSGGGIPDYTICNFPSPTPNSSGLPYGTAFISASADSVTSNPVEVYIHAPISAVTLALNGSQTGQTCYSQGAIVQLDAEACYSSNGQQYEFCAPSTVSPANYSCKGGLPPGAKSVPDCTAAIGTLSFNVGTASVAVINEENNQITAQLPGTTAITASIAGSGSSAGYFSTCPPKSISLALANGATTGTVTQGVQQNLTTTVVDTNGNAITGLTLDYQSTNPLNLTAGAAGAISATFPGSATVTAVCQPSTCNPSPINQIGAGNGTGLSISSNPVNITTPGTASAYMWFAAPGKSQYFVPVLLLNGTLGSTVRLPYVPNSMVMDQTGSDLYFGSAHELIIASTTNNTVTREDPTVPGVVLAVAPNNDSILINDPVRQVFYLYGIGSTTVTSTFGGMGTAAEWTSDSKTLYITDTAAAGPGHSNTLYVYNANTGWTSCTAGQPCAQNFTGASNLAVTIPGVGAYFAGTNTEARTWCPAGQVGNYGGTTFYPEGDDVTNSTAGQVPTDILAATVDGDHILGAKYSGGTTTLSDIGITIPTLSTTQTNGTSIKTPSACPVSSAGVMAPLTITHTLVQAPINISATGVNQIVSSPAAVVQGTSAAAYSLSFITYNGTTTGATLPYYQQVAGSSATLGTVGYLPLAGSSAITAPVAGAFSADNALFFVSTAGDNKIHYIDAQKALSDPAHADTQQVSPNLPACTPGSDPDCTLTTAPASGVVPTTAIAVKPRATT